MTSAPCVVSTTRLSTAIARRDYVNKTRSSSHRPERLERRRSGPSERNVSCVRSTLFNRWLRPRAPGFLPGAALAMKRSHQPEVP